MNIPRPDGFRVDEVTGDYQEGRHTHFTLWKKDYNTLDAVKTIARCLKVSVKRFNYAGLKDKHAVTTQRVSAWRVPAKRLKELSLKDIRILDVKEGLERVTIGSHKGNSFKITLTGVKKEGLRTPRRVPNYFGPQRFGGNELIGEKLVEQDWKGAVELLNPQGSYEKRVFKYLKQRHGDYLGALKKVDKKIRVLWVNAWQARQWNKKLDTSKRAQELPSIKEIPEMKELGSFPGGARATTFQPEDYKVKELTNNVRVAFTLPRGCYATTLINYILKRN